MKRLIEADLEELFEERPGTCISLYFSTSPPGPRTPQGPVRLQRLLGQARHDLRTRGLSDIAIETLLEPLEDLPTDASFWNDREEGIALFRAPDFTRLFRLPVAFPERCAIGGHFFLKPLLPLVAGNDRFYVLALSQNEVRLLQATARTDRRITAKDLPGSLVEALGGQKTSQELQFHAAGSGAAGAPAVYHGQGVGREDEKAELRRFLHQVDAAVCRLLAGRRSPLVLAGAEPLPSLYREISGYPWVAAAVIPGNPEHLRDEELRDRAWKLLEPSFQESRRHMAERYGELSRTGRASADVSKILPAARHGRVEALFVNCDEEVWGRVDDIAGEVRIHASQENGDEDLLDAAALFSLRNGGTVYGVGRGEVPGGGRLAAVFRY